MGLRSSTCFDNHKSRVADVQWRFDYLVVKRWCFCVRALALMFGSCREARANVRRNVTSLLFDRGEAIRVTA